MEGGIYLCIFFIVFSGVTSQSVTITEDTVYIMNNVVGQVTCSLTGSCASIDWNLSNTAAIATAFVGGTCSNTTSGYYQTCNDQNHQYTLYFTGTTNLHGEKLRCSGDGCTPQQTVSDTVTISIIGVSSQSVTITEDTVYIMNNVVGQVICTLYGNYGDIFCIGVSSQSVTITEDTVYIMNNVVGQVICTLYGNCGGIAWYLLSSPVASAFVGFTCPNTTKGYYQTCDDQNHQYTLYFTGTTNLHGQTLRCSGEGCTPQQTVSDTVTISIIVPVPSVALEGITGQEITVTAGQSKSITCVTGSSRPASRILWYIGAANVTSLSTETQISSRELFYTRSILTFIPTKSQNGLQVNCKAYNTDNNIMELTTKPTLNVQYPPNDTNAVIKQGDTISTKEGNSTTLVCEVRGGHPLATITWDCFGLPGASSTDRDISRSTLNFMAHRSHNRQTCTCRATHPTVNLGSDSVTINVYYGPTSVSYQPGVMSYTRNEGDNLGPIQCVSDCNPKCNLVWTGTGQSDYIGENLTISSITRRQEGEYKCTASNSYGSKSGSKISVVVNFY